MNAREKQMAAIAGREAVEADRRGDTTSRDRALLELFGAAGYWKTCRRPPSAGFNGVPPKMVRMPRGRAVEWRNRFKAAEAWANE